MNSTHKAIIALLYLGILSLLLASIFWIDRHIPREGEEEPFIERVDTLYLRDTIVVTKPVYVDRRVVDSVLVPVTDTVRISDTLFVTMAKEQVIWEDSLSRVYASGIQPQVDSVAHFVQERVVFRYVPVKRASKWGIGVQGGYGFSKEGLSPYVGVGVSYNVLSW